MLRVLASTYESEIRLEEDIQTAGFRSASGVAMEVSETHRRLTSTIGSNQA